jgi:hypothetical protein
MKCTRCKLVNPTNTDICKRCFTPLLNKVKQSNESQGGICRDNKMLVIELRALLPKRCYKCNSREVAWHRSQEIEYVPFLQAALKFAVGQVIPVPIPLPLTPGKRKRNLELSFCRKHRGLKHWLMKFGFGTLGLGVLCFGAALLMKDSPDGFVYLSIASVIIFCIGLLTVYGATEHNAVEVDSFRHEYFWIKGFGEEYLKSFPSLADAQRK